MLQWMVEAGLGRVGGGEGRVCPASSKTARKRSRRHLRIPQNQAPAPSARPPAPFTRETSQVRNPPRPCTGKAPHLRGAGPVDVAQRGCDWRTKRPGTQTGGPEGPPVAGGHDPLARSGDYRSSDRTDCGAWLACESMLVPACCRICDFVNSTISSAMSTSRIRLSAEIRFS
jgi:hypothetical protein